jgi:ABC-type antimicrobial peptide transport system permease subunit
VVRTSLPPETLVPAIRQALLQLDPEMPIDDVRTMETRIDDSLVARRSPAVLAAIFATLALVLAAIGTYGVLAYSVSQRRREIGVRMALGAQPAQIGRQFLALGGRLLVAGMAFGVFGTWAAGRAMQTILFNVPAMRPSVLATTAAMMALVSIAACFFPARRASKVDPMIAMRTE